MTNNRFVLLPGFVDLIVVLWIAVLGGLVVLVFVCGWSYGLKLGI